MLWYEWDNYTIHLRTISLLANNSLMDNFACFAQEPLKGSLRSTMQLKLVIVRGLSKGRWGVGVRVTYFVPLLYPYP